MSRQSLGVAKDITDIETTAPSGDVGLTIGYMGQLKPTKWMLEVTIGVASDDVFLWGQVRDLANTDPDEGDGGNTDRANGVWGLHNDKHGRFLDGKLAVGAAKLAVGTHFFVLEDVGGYIALALQNTASGGSTCTGKLWELVERGGRA